MVHLRAHAYSHKESSKPILIPGYELRPRLINMLQDQPFSGEDDENPYSHQNEFE